MKWHKDLLVLVTAVLGGIVGHYAFMWLLSRGFYALVLPGGLVGIAAGIPKHGRSYLAAVCGLLALAAGLFSEGTGRPFVADESWSYFFSHLHQLEPFTWLMIIVGTAMGFWIPFRRSQDYGPNYRPPTES